MIDWRPIYSAPKDETVVLLRVPDSEHGILVAFWAEAEGTAETGWYESEAGSTPIGYEITHWAEVTFPEIKP